MPKTISLAREQSLFDSIPVEILFIEEYMPTAPGDYVKVYLYLKHSLHAGQPELELAWLSRMLELEPTTVTEALSYWVRRGVLQQTADGGYRFVHLPTRTLTTHARDPELDAKLETNKPFQQALQACFGNRYLKPEELTRALEWAAVPGSGHHMVLCACGYAVANSRVGRRVSFRYVEKTLQGWWAAGVTNEQAQMKMETAQRATGGAAEVLRRLGTPRIPSQDEAELYRKWTQDWQFTHEAVLAACANTTGARQPSLAYLDRVLESLMTSTARDGQSVAAQAEQRTGRRRLAASVQKLFGMAGTVLPAVEEQCRAAADMGLDDAAVMASAKATARRYGGMAAWQRELERLAASGCTTAAEIDAYYGHRRNLEEGLLQACDIMGHQRRISPAEVTLYEGWRKRFEPELILLAAGYAVGTKAPLRYVDKLLAGWHQSGVASPEAARAAQAGHQSGAGVGGGGARTGFAPVGAQSGAGAGAGVAAGAQGGATAKGAQAGTHVNYQQRTYTDEELRERFTL